MAGNRKLKVKPTPPRTNHNLIFLRTYEIIKTASLFYRAVNANIVTALYYGNSNVK